MKVQEQFWGVCRLNIFMFVLQYWIYFLTVLFYRTTLPSGFSTPGGLCVPRWVKFIVLRMKPPRAFSWMNYSKRAQIGFQPKQTCVGAEASSNTPSPPAKVCCSILDMHLCLTLTLMIIIVNISISFFPGEGGVAAVSPSTALNQEPQDASTSCHDDVIPLLLTLVVTTMSFH